MAGGPSILFVCDAGPSVGGGHVMRSLTLAAALSERGARCTFLADAFTDGLLDRYDRVGCARVAAADHRPNTLIAAAEKLGFDGVVIDHFAWGVGQDRALDGVAPVRVAVDDETMRVRDVDVWIDCNLGRLENELICWGDRADLPTWLLLGPDYAPVRPEFVEAREGALARKSGGGLKRVLVSLGLTDVSAITARVVRTIRPHLGDIQLDIVLAEGTPSRRPIRQLMAMDPRLVLHTDVRDMAGLMASVDLCIGAGGSSTWERACLGLPTVTIVLAPNQEPGTTAVAAAGATLRLIDCDPDFEEKLERTFIAMRDEPQRRADLSARAAALCDGQGADRSATAILRRLRLQARG